tara:strand:+ start:466 stop:567 length:102 start_codon:yes stop_codon:yes gene_type:complete
MITVEEGKISLIGASVGYSFVETREINGMNTCN